MSAAHGPNTGTDRRVVINEVGLRDGLQNFPVILSTDAKLDLYNALRRAGLSHFELTSFVSPKAVPALADAADFVARVPREDRQTLTALVPNRKGYDRARAAGLRSVAVVLAATETLNRKNIRMSLQAAAAECAAVCAVAKEDGVHVRAYIAAACACPYEGGTDLRHVLDLAAAMVEAGADEIALADTIGAGHPAQVEALFGAAVARFGAARLAAHFHDTRAMALTLSWVALAAGVRRFDASIGGLGGCPFAPGASGNLATEDLAFMLEQSGFETGLSVDGLMAAADLAGRL
ncbi:MAG TPA: hydroxymethylglutaryl-CoA lyase, partial [Vineibacter sp.]|nr:hydroxymethylglutaryl-CoA lyase [Vineibacter sp.]